MVSKVERTLLQYQMIAPGDRVLIGLSGGGDSVALLYCLMELAPKMGFSVFCAHLHHGIRGEEADRDEAFCRALCEKKKITLFTTRRDIPRLAKEGSLSVELCAREERYAFFDRVSRENDLTRVATAHHLGDNTETALLHLVRGTGPEGLRGIDPCRGSLIRPLIMVSKKEIEAFLASREIPFVNDSSNLCDDYTRNKIRNRVVPLLEEINPSLGEGILRMNELMRQENDYMEKAARLAYVNLAKEGEDQISIDLAPFGESHPAIRRRLLQLAYQRLTGQKLKSSLVFSTGLLAEKQIPSKKLYLGEAVAKIEYEKLIITKKIGENITEPYAFEVNIGGENTEICHLGFRILTRIVDSEGLKEAKIQKKFKVCLFNYDIIYDKVISRNRRIGDSYVPLGGIGRRTVKKMMIDEKIPSDIRDTLPVFTCKEDVLWAYGLRMNDSYKVTPETKKILMVTVIEEEKHDK